MKHSIGIWQLFGFAVSSFLGTLLHFLYEWLGESVWVAAFSGVNESTFEHMKLLFWPMLLFAAIESLFFREREDFWCVKLCGILLGLSLIPLLFYTYNGIIGSSPAWVNIAIFFVSAAAAYIFETVKFVSGGVACKNPRRALVLILIIALCFVVFTFATPRINLFRDPLTDSYGI